MIIADVEVYASAATVRRRDERHRVDNRKINGQKSVSGSEPEDQPLPNGASGLKVQFHFLDPKWKELSKTAVFRNGKLSVDAVIINGCATVPHEVLTKVMDTVYVGVYGTDSVRNVAIPTVWARLGTVAGAANPSGKSSAEATLPYWAQIKEQLDTCQNEMLTRTELDNALIEAKESGMFDGPRGEKGDKGDKGDKGADGAPGQSPVKGVDYWTAEERDAIVAETVDLTCEELQGGYDVVTTEKGDTIILTDSLSRRLHGLTLYGKTTQNGVSSFVNPIMWDNAGSAGSVTVSVGKSDTDENLQELTVLTPNGLPGIPTTSGGNYIDQSGKQWICDEMNLEKGVYIKRCMTIEIDSSREILNVAKIGENTKIEVALYDSERISNNSVGYFSHGKYRNSISEDSEHGYAYSYRLLIFLPIEATEAAAKAYFDEQKQNGTPVTIIYALDNAQEIPLTNDVASGYSSLDTYYPATRISNDAGVGMEVKYVVNTQKYIDKKIAELASAMLNA